MYLFNRASIHLNSVNYKLVYGCLWAIEQSNYIVTKQCSQHTPARLDNINIYKMLYSLIVKLQFLVSEFFKFDTF